MTKEQRAVRTTQAIKDYQAAPFGKNTHTCFYHTDIENIWELTREEWGSYQASAAIGKALEAGYIMGYRQALRDIKKGKAANV